MRNSLCTQAFVSLALGTFLPRFLFLLSAGSQAWRKSCSRGIIWKILLLVTLYFFCTRMFRGFGWCGKVPIDGMKFKCGHEVTALFHSVRWYVESLHWKLHFANWEVVVRIKYEVWFWRGAVSMGGFISKALKPWQKNCLCPVPITQSLSTQLHIHSEMASISTDTQNI